MTENGVVEPETRFQLVEHLAAALDVQAQVVSLGQLLDHVGHLTAAPVFHAMNLTVLRRDQLLVALDHRRNLFALVRMDDKYDFIVTHCFSLWSDYRIAHPGVRTSVGRGKPDMIRGNTQKLNLLRELSLCLIKKE